jgi:hypothetical protein
MEEIWKNTRINKPKLNYQRTEIKINFPRGKEGI